MNIAPPSLTALKIIFKCKAIRKCVTESITKPRLALHLSFTKIKNAPTLSLEKIKLRGEDLGPHGSTRAFNSFYSAFAMKRWAVSLFLRAVQV
jgi:hypothetical protein